MKRGGKRGKRHACGGGDLLKCCPLGTHAKDREKEGGSGWRKINWEVRKLYRGMSGQPQCWVTNPLCLGGIEWLHKGLSSLGVEWTWEVLRNNQVGGSALNQSRGKTPPSLGKNLSTQGLQWGNREQIT